MAESLYQIERKESRRARTNVIPRGMALMRCPREMLTLIGFPTPIGNCDGATELCVLSQRTSNENNRIR